MDDNELENIIELSDEDGNPVRFEFLDLIEYDGEEYVVLLPAEDEEADEVVILRVEPDEDDPESENYVSVEDEDILQEIFEIFKKKFKDDFKFED